MDLMLCAVLLGKGYPAGVERPSGVAPELLQSPLSGCERLSTEEAGKLCEDPTEATAFLSQLWVFCSKRTPWLSSLQRGGGGSREELGGRGPLPTLWNTGLRGQVVPGPLDTGREQMPLDL